MCVHVCICGCFFYICACKSVCFICIRCDGIEVENYEFACNIFCLIAARSDANTCFVDESVRRGVWRHCLLRRQLIVIRKFAFAFNSFRLNASLFTLFCIYIYYLNFFVCVCVFLCIYYHISG